MPKLTAVILSKNEEKNIKDALKSVDFANEILVIDDFSTDQTALQAKKLGATVINHKLNQDFAQQRNFAISKAKYDWIFFLDADERVTPELKQYLLTFSPALSDSAFLINRVDFFWGKQLKYGETGQIYVSRLINKNKGCFSRPVHEIWQAQGTVHKINKPIYHYPHQSLSEFVQHINNYSTLNALYWLKQEKQTNLLDLVITPTGKFFYNYIFKFGLFDGIQGLVYSLLMSFHSFLSRAKLYLLYQNG